MCSTWLAKYGKVTADVNAVLPACELSGVLPNPVLHYLPASLPWLCQRFLTLAMFTLLLVQHRQPKALPSCFFTLALFTRGFVDAWMLAGV
jgi:hypothetical protein